MTAATRTDAQTAPEQPSPAPAVEETLEAASPSAEEPTTTATAPAAAAAQLTPRQAWEKLQAGNLRFVEGASEHPNQNASRRESLTQSQNPFATIFGCSDSRLAAEIIFDLGLGDTFVVRTAGQVIDDAVIGTLEYSVEVLNVPLIVVLGHDSCGAVTATRESVRSGEMPRGFQRSLVERIMPAVLDSQRAGRDSVDEIVEANVEMVAHRILDQSRSIASAVSSGRVAIVGMCYSLQHGRAKLTFGHGSWLDVPEHDGVEHQG